MDFLNLQTTQLRKPEFSHADAANRGTWLSLQLHSVAVENSGIIVGCRGWNGQHWLKTIGISKADALKASSLWHWEGQDLHLWGYPHSSQHQVQAGREGGKNGGRPRKDAEKAPPPGNPAGNPPLNPAGNHKGKGKDKGRVMEGEGEGSSPPSPTHEMPPSALSETSEVDLLQVEGLDSVEKKKEGSGDPPDLTIYLALAESHAKGSPDGFSIPPAFVRHWHDIRVARDWERGNGQPIPNTDAARWADLKAMAREEHHRGGLAAYASGVALSPAQKKKAASGLTIVEPDGDWRKFCREVLLFEPAVDWHGIALRLQQEIWNAWQAEKNKEEGGE